MVENIDLNLILKTAESVCSALKPLSEHEKNFKKSPLLQKANPFQMRSQRTHDQDCKDKTRLLSSDEKNRMMRFT